ncbi:hypothetical protein D3C76_1712240 [compost metagenome]
MQARFQLTGHPGDESRLNTEQLFKLGVVHFIGLEIPVPQAQFTGLQRQRQTGFAFAQSLIGVVQFKTALRHPALQLYLCGAQ